MQRGACWCGLLSLSGPNAEAPGHVVGTGDSCFRPLSHTPPFIYPLGLHRCHRVILRVKDRM